MRKSIITALPLLIAVNLFAQNSLTNTISEFSINSRSWVNLQKISEISEIFKARISTEINTDLLTAGIIEISSPTAIKLREQGNTNFTGNLRISTVSKEISFTNTTLEEVIGTFVGNIPNHAWRYDCDKDNIYIHPLTNLVSMTRIGSVSLTNEMVFEFGKTLYKYDLKLWTRFNPNKISSNERDISQDIISLEFEDAYLYEILDAVVAQIPDARGWTIMGKRIYFRGKNKD